MAHFTPLRYPGGKSRLGSFARLLLEKNGLIGGEYAEAYAGGAGLALHLLFHNCVTRIHINDLSTSVYAFWKSSLDDTDNLCQLISDTPVTIESWQKQKKVQENPSKHSLLKLGFSTFFLNRTNHSGIITGDAGVIGGKKQEGEWLIDARYNKSDLVSRIQKVAQNKNRIKLYNQDAKDFIIKTASALPVKSLIYFDPPYYSKGKRLYKDYYQHDDHVDIATHIKALKHNWVVSYDNQPQIRKLYKGYRSLTYKLGYSVNQHYQGSETIFFCNDLAIPNIKDPVNVDRLLIQSTLQL